MAYTRRDGTAFVPLPASARCTGREHEMTMLVEALLTEDSLPIPILGAPGVGKSILALAALYHDRVIDHFGTRRLFIPCDGLQTCAALVVHIAYGLGLTLSVGVASALLPALTQAPIALVFDDIETLWQADIDAVTQFLVQVSTLPNVALLATMRSQQPLRGVRWHDTIALAPLCLGAARQLFLTLAGEQYASDPHLDDLVDQQEGMPLQFALLAQAVAGASSLASLWQHWQQTQARVEDHLTPLERTFELSLQSARMTDDARQLLSLLALLPCGIARVDIPHVLPDASEQAVSALRETGLAFDDGYRLRVPLPIREYMQRAHPVQLESQVHMADYYIRMIHMHGLNTGPSANRAAPERLLSEVANTEAMLLLGLQQLDIDQVMEGASILQAFCHTVGLGSSPTLERVLRLVNASDSLEREADCIKILGDLALEKHDFLGAIGRYEEALPLYRQAHCSLGEANCLKRLGDIALRQGNHRRASLYYERALSLYQQIQHPLREANCRKSLGDTALQQGMFHQAQKRYAEALPLYQQVGSLLGEANCIRALGDLAWQQVEHAEAQTRYEEALTIYNRIPEPYSIGGTHRRLARLASTPEAMHEHVREARTVWEIIDRADLLAELTAEFGELP